MSEVGKMDNDKILNLCILGRDRIYQTLIEIEKVIDFCDKNNYYDVSDMLIFKKSEVEAQKVEATEIINQIKGVRE